MRAPSHERHSVWFGSLLCTILLVFLIGSLAAVAQATQGAGESSNTVASVPNAPVAGPGNHAPLSGNGAPEFSNAPPQLRQTIEDQSDDQENPAFLSRHLIAGRFWISGQANFIVQAHTPFHSPYSGPNSFHGYGENALSRTITLYTGIRLRRFTEFIASVDEAGGRGLSDGSGIAAYLNADVINPDLSRGVYVSRSFVHNTIALTADRIEEAPNPFYLQPSLPRRRVEFTFGKFSLLDFFDVNEVGSDTHLQFTNIAIGNTGTYENGSDGHGDTLAGMFNYQGPKLGFRFAEALLPKVATGTDLDYDLRHTHAENFSVDYSTYAMQGYATHVRGLVFVSHADLGNYREANDAYLASRDRKPDITLHRHQGTVKPGLGLSFEQDLPRNFRVFWRTGWNDGNYESFTYSEMNNTIAFGADLSGDAWHRKDDRIGSAFVNSGLSHDHREYLALGGIGFMLGDGGLRYGRESVSETYYTAHVIGGLYLAAQISFVNNPGCNRDRGPIIVPGLRAHIDF
jgi:high affinity Mn2+ porin